MNDCSNLFFLSALACKLSQCLDEKELALLATELTALGDLLAAQLVQRPINNWINHAECFFECTGQKTQAQRATSRTFDLCNRRSRQVIGVVIFETLYQLTKLQNADIKSCMIVRQMSKLLENHTWLLQQKNPGNLTVPGHLTFGHNTPDGVIYMILSVNQ